jgi:hypothetical protein
MEPETRVEKCQKLSRWFSNSRSGSRTVKCDEKEPRSEYLRHKTNTTLPIETTWDQREREKERKPRSCLQSPVLFNEWLWCSYCRMINEVYYIFAGRQVVKQRSQKTRFPRQQSAHNHRGSLRWSVPRGYKEDKWSKTGPEHGSRGIAIVRSRV